MIASSVFNKSWFILKNNQKVIFYNSIYQNILNIFFNELLYKLMYIFVNFCQQFKKWPYFEEPGELSSRKKRSQNRRKIETIIQKFYYISSVSEKSCLNLKWSKKREKSQNEPFLLFLKLGFWPIRTVKNLPQISYGLLQLILKDDLHLKGYKDYTRF